MKHPNIMSQSISGIWNVVRKDDKAADPLTSTGINVIKQSTVNFHISGRNLRNQQELQSLFSEENSDPKLKQLSTPIDSGLIYSDMTKAIPSSSVSKK